MDSRQQMNSNGMPPPPQRGVPLQDQMQNNIFVESLVEDVIDNNMIDNMQGIAEIGINAIGNAINQRSDEEYASMGIDLNTVGASTVNNVSDIAESDLIRRGRSLYNEVMPLGQDETFDVNQVDYMSADDSDMSGIEGDMDSYENQQAAENMANNMNSQPELSTKQKLTMIIVTIVLIIICFNIIGTLLSNFFKNSESIEESDVVSEAVDQLRGQKTQTDEEIEQYVDSMLSSGQEVNEQINVQDQMDTVNTDDTLPEVEQNNGHNITDNSPEEDIQITNEPGDYRNKETDAVGKLYFDTIKSLRYSDGIYEPKYDDKYMLDTHNHLLYVSGCERIKGKLISAKYTTETSTQKAIVEAPDGTLWRVDFATFDDKMSAKDCGIMNVYIYPSDVINEIVSVESASIEKSYTKKELVQ